MHFLGAKQPESAKPPPIGPQVDDAVALVPLIRGAFRKQLSGNTLIPLQRPLLGLRLPTVDLRRRAWTDLQVGPTFIKANEQLNLHYYDTLDKPVVEGVADPKPPFAKALEKINAIDADLVKSLLTNRETIIDNAVRIRKGIITKVREVIGSGESTDEKPRERYNSLLEGFKDDWDAGVHAYRHERVNFTAGVDADQWKRLPDLAKLVELTKDGGVALEATLKEQETHQFNVIIASMQLQIKYYAALIAVMSAQGFNSKLVRDAVRQAECMESTDPIGTKTKHEFTDKCGRFLKALLQERLELMQANIYTYFTALLGQNDVATRLTVDVTVSAVFGVFSAFYDRSSITRRTDQQFRDTVINNQGADNKVLLGLISSFATRYVLPKLSAKGLGEITDAAVASIVQNFTNFFKGSLRARSDASTEIVAHIEAALNANKLILNTSHAPTGGKHKNGVSLSMPKPGDQFPAFRHVINAEVSKNFTAAGGAVRNAAFDVAASIVHAVGQSNPIFALSLCARSSSEPKEHFSVFPACLQSKAERAPAAGDEGRATNSLLQKASWVETFLDGKVELRGFTPVADIDRLFVLKTTLHPAHTPQHASARAEHRKDPPGKKDPPAAKKDGEKKKPGDGKKKQPEAKHKGDKPKQGGRKKN